MMKIGNKTFRDRRGAAQRIIDQVKKNGCLPRYANYRTVTKLQDEGAIHFGPTSCGWCFKIGPEPKTNEGN